MSRRDELRAAQIAIAYAIAQHASYSYRASTAVANRINDVIDRLAKDLTSELAERLDGLSQAELDAFVAGKYTTSRLKALKAEIDGWGKAIAEAIESEWEESAIALAGFEAAYVVDLMREAFDDVPKVAPKPNEIFRKALQTPIMGRHVQDMARALAPKQVEQVYSIIRNGIASGQTNGDIIRALRGTKALGYKDGLMHAAKADVERFVRTARNHVANVAGEEMWRELGVTYLKRMAALEGRTCGVCAALDGKVYAIDEPKPAATLHPNCRCRYIAALDDEVVGNRPFVRALKVRKRDGTYRFRSIGDMTKKQREEAGLQVGQVKATTTFGKWFANQDATFQKQWLGPARYRLYKEGGLSLDRFVDPIAGRQYSLEELRRRDEDTFKAVFGEA